MSEIYQCLLKVWSLAGDIRALLSSISVDLKLNNAKLDAIEKLLSKEKTK